MADTTTDKEKFGCSAWLESIRGTMNERWTRARNTLQRKVHRGNKIVQPLTPVGQLAGSDDLVVARKRALCPRPAIVDIREDIYSMRAMISYLDSADKFNFDTKKDEFSEIEDDVESFVHEILCKVSKELEEELRKFRVTLASSLYTVSRSSSVTSSQLSDIAETVVNDSLTRIISPFEDFEQDLDLQLECKKLQNDFDSGMYCNTPIEVAE